MRDVVVIGSGHNALVAACYLTRAGLDVEVVERDTVLGGAVSTVERWPGYQVDRGSSAHVMIRRTGIIEELRLAECGLRYLEMDPWAWAPFGAEAIAFSTSLDATCASIAAVCGDKDAEAYARFARTWAVRMQPVFETFGDAATPARVGRRLARVGRGGDPWEVTRLLLAPADQLLDQTFDDERLRTALAWLAAQAGPPSHEAGTGAQLAWYALLHNENAPGPGRAVGGSGALCAALAERLRRSGGTLRLGDGAARLTRTGHRVDGVVTASGERIAARAVLAGCHVVTTFELLGDDVLLDSVRRRVRVGNGIGIAVRIGARGLPRYAAARDDSPYGAMQLLVRSRAQLRGAYGDFLAGRPPAEPAVLGMTFSAIDPSLAPPGRHNITLWAQWFPYDLAGGATWDEPARRVAGNAVIEQVERVAPGFRDMIDHVYVQTPLDLERELGLLRGNVMHVEMGLDAMFLTRPLPELAAHRTPVDGLYLTGASTHPGGGVSGSSGRTAARILLADRGRRARRSRG